MRKFAAFFSLVFLSQSLIAAEPPPTTIDDLWVIDSSQYSTGLMLDVNDNIHHYFEALKNANVDSRGVFISANAIATQHNPIKSERGRILFPDHPDLTIDWWERWSDAWRVYTDQSPLVALRRFYLKLPGLSEVYESSYHRPNIPANVTVFVSYLDGFHKHYIGSPQEFWGPKDFVQSFKDFHKKSNKPFQINIVAEKDLTVIAPPGGIDYVYTQMTQETGGTLYSWQRGTDMKAIMTKLAENAVKRARQ